MRDAELLRLEHERSLERVRSLGEIRFRLLAFIPTIAGAAVAVLPSRGGPAAMLAVGLVGLAATLGVFLYELRNTEVVAELARRLLLLERGVDPDTASAPAAEGRLDADDAASGARLLGVVRPTRARGVALIYAAALAGWVYLVVWGGLALLEVGGADLVGGLVALGTGVAVVVGAERFAAATTLPERRSG